MEFEIGELDTHITLTDAGDLVDRRSFDRLVAATTRRVLEELQRQERERRTRLDSRRVDPERY